MRGPVTTTAAVLGLAMAGHGSSGSGGGPAAISLVDADQTSDAGPVRSDVVESDVIQPDPLQPDAVQPPTADTGGQVNLGRDAAQSWGGFKLTVRAKGIEGGGVRVETFDLDAQTDAQADPQIDIAPTVNFSVAAAAAAWSLPEVRGSLSWQPVAPTSARPESSTLFVANVQTEQPLTLASPSGLQGEVRSVSGGVKVQHDASGLHLVDGSLAMDGGSVQMGDVGVSEAQFVAAMPNAKTVEVTSLGAVVGDGGTVIADPFTWTVGTTEVATGITVSNLNLSQWLPILTSNRATGEGRVSGRVDAAAEWSTGTVRLAELKGTLGADPQRGFIQAMDADALGELLEKQDPRFAEDGMMGPVREKIIAALRDFAFQKLSVDLSRRGDRTTALTYLSGFGRHGEDPQGLNLTLDVNVQDSFLGLASRIAAKGRIKESAQTALEEFFQDAQKAEEKP